MRRNFGLIFLVLLRAPSCRAFLLSSCPACQYRSQISGTFRIDALTNQEDEANDDESPQEKSSSSLPFATYPMLQWNLTSLLNVNNSPSDKNIHLLRKVYQDAVQAFQDTTEEIMAMDYPTDQPDPSLSLQPVQIFIQSYSHDRGHDGRFAIPPQRQQQQDGAASPKKDCDRNVFYSMPGNLAFSMEHPLSYIRDTLSYRPLVSPSEQQQQPPNHKSKKEEEVVVVLPGLHTPIQSAWDQLQFLSNVMDGMPMALLQVGSFACHQSGTSPSTTSTPTPPTAANSTVLINLTPDALDELRSLDLILEPESTPSSSSSSSEEYFRIGLGDLDLMRPLLANTQIIIDNPQLLLQVEDLLVVEALVKLLDVAVDSVRTPTSQEEDDPHLVLFCSSINAHLVASAIQRWKYLAITPLSSNNELRCATALTQEQAEALLREAVTIVTLNSLCQTFPDGPAYIHISMHDDQLAKQFGIRRRDHTSTTDHNDGGGQDALILRAISPYRPHHITDDGIDEQSTNQLYYSNDAHNICACAIQFLYLTLRINGLTTLRELYHAGCQPTPKLDIKPSLYALTYDAAIGNLEMPQDELLLATIQATGAERWLWWPIHSSDAEDDDDSPLPDALYALATMEEHFGYGAYEEIWEACR